MNPFRHGLLAARTAAVMPRRHRQLATLSAEGNAPLSVLFYHRVADSHPNSWTIGCQRFRQQIDYCEQHFEFIDLAEMQLRMEIGQSRRPAVCLTFDDGYRDNSDFALPLLIQRRIPCTYFVCTANILNQTPFPQDEATGQPLAVNSVEQIQAAADAGIEIGCHTKHHVDFSHVHDERTVRDEIIHAKAELENLIDRPVRYFAFPYGMPEHLTRVAVDAVIEAGFDGFCSAYGGYNLPGEHPFHIRRFHGDPEMARFKNWLSFDSRKLQKKVQLDFSLPTNRIPTLPIPTMMTSEFSVIG
ncbi:MAG: polysaccharide deacetylase family protein [Rubripirellula sp.]|nr:polysaccharide deacetylase family protein [Rubripirellula sp.]